MAQIAINVANPMQDLQRVIAAENARLAQEGLGTKVQRSPLPQPGEGCRERFLVWHLRQRGADFQNGACHHPWRPDRRDERRKEPITLRDVLGAIYGEDVG